MNMIGKISRKVFYKAPLLVKAYHLFLNFFGVVWYRWPSRKIFVIGVTGTKGKSTALELINSILEAAGEKTALLSSIRIKVGEFSEDNFTGNTMPGRFFIQRFLGQAVKAGCKYAFIEVTSEGVVLSRHKFINWGAAVFLNLHPEHIEAHGGFEKYREAKLDFFRYVSSKKIPSANRRAIRQLAEQTSTEIHPPASGTNFAHKIFVVNKDDENAKYFIEAAGGNKVILFGKSALKSQLIGEFNKYNVGAAETVAKELGVVDEAIQKAVAEFSGAPGRMEFIQHEPFAVVIDYAHTPDSLKAAYTALQENPKFNPPAGGQSPKLICVLGSAGGGRDKWKRPEMGKIAAEYCDEIILTNEDPYDEIPEKIIEDIYSGISQALSSKSKTLNNSEISNPKTQKILDRKEAIKTAIGLARAGDNVVITGKGSERFIHMEKGKKIPWSDKQTALEILKGNN